MHGEARNGASQTRARRTANVVASAVTARIKRIYVKDGDLVKKGQILVELNEEDFINNIVTYNICLLLS